MQTTGLNPCIACGVSGWMLAQLSKVIINFLLRHKWQWRLLWSSGGMPSSHTACTVALTVSVGLVEGFNTSLFAIALVFTLIVMYDAAGVRLQTGKQGAMINQILKSVFVDGKPISEEYLKEIVGHKPSEVFFGFITGLVVVGIYYLIFAV